jgi:hypothetical protein
MPVLSGLERNSQVENMLFAACTAIVQNLTILASDPARAIYDQKFDGGFFLDLNAAPK